MREEKQKADSKVNKLEDELMSLRARLSTMDSEYDELKGKYDIANSAARSIEAMTTEKSQLLIRIQELEASCNASKQIEILKEKLEADLISAKERVISS